MDIFWECYAEKWRNKQSIWFQDFFWLWLLSILLAGKVVLKCNGSQFFSFVSKTKTCCIHDLRGFLEELICYHQYLKMGPDRKTPRRGRWAPGGIGLVNNYLLWLEILVAFDHYVRHSQALETQSSTDFDFFKKCKLTTLRSLMKRTDGTSSIDCQRAKVTKKKQFHHI